MARKLRRSSALCARLLTTLPCIAVIAVILLCAGAPSVAEGTLKEEVMLHCGNPPATSWFVMIKGRRLECFGSLITDKWIVTSAQCMRRAHGKESYVAFNGDKVSNIWNIISLDSPETEKNSSLALVKVKPAVPLSTPSIRPICLPRIEEYNGMEGYTFVQNATGVFKIKVFISKNFIYSYASQMIDNCQYVEGSPVMAKEYGRYFLVGVTDSGDCTSAEYTWLAPHNNSIVKMVELV